MNRLAITTRELDISRHVALASQYQTGIELQVYGYNPDLLDGDWRSLVASHREALRGFTGEIALHGAFYDMNSASADSRITALTAERYRASLRVAAELGARHTVFHANYLPFIQHPSYLPEWTRKQVAFWDALTEEARRLGLIIALENMWEPEPDIIAAVLEEVNSPHLRACLDIGHVYLYSNSLPFPDWLKRLGNWVVHVHANNHRGHYDEHLPLDVEGGAIDYSAVLPLLSELPSPPLVSLEMEHTEDLERSLRYLGR
jgi:sugar phosphate isomerase/epimerase